MNIWKWTTFALAGVLAASVAMHGAEGGERQPHMRSALVNLRSAKAQLEKAENDAGGHRTRAIELSQQAIDEVQKGVDSGAE